MCDRSPGGGTKPISGGCSPSCRGVDDAIWGSGLRSLASERFTGMRQTNSMYGAAILAVRACPRGLRSRIRNTSLGSGQLPRFYRRGHLPSFGIGIHLVLALAWLAEFPVLHPEGVSAAVVRLRQITPLWVDFGRSLVRYSHVWPRAKATEKSVPGRQITYSGKSEEDGR